MVRGEDGVMVRGEDGMRVRARLTVKMGNECECAGLCECEGV